MTDLALVRENAREWCELAVNGEHGRKSKDPVYQWITGGRDPGPRYSSCADLAHWLLRRLGCVEGFVNYGANWKPQVNVNRLWNNPYVALRGVELHTGDILIHWPTAKPNAAHVNVFDRWEDGVCHTWDLGQAPMAPELWPPGKDYTEAARRQHSHLRNLRYVLSLSEVPLLGTPDPPHSDRLAFLEAQTDWRKMEEYP